MSNTELWIRRLCRHGNHYPHVFSTGMGLTYKQEDCPGGSEERLDPDRVVWTEVYPPAPVTVRDILDELDEA